MGDGWGMVGFEGCDEAACGEESTCRAEAGRRHQAENRCEMGSRSSVNERTVPFSCAYNRRSSFSRGTTCSKKKAWLI